MMCAQTRGIPVDPAQVVVTPGGKPIMFFVILALIERGDEVLMPNPSFPIYESMVNFVGGTPSSCRCGRRTTSGSTSTSSRRDSPTRRNWSSSTPPPTPPAAC